MLFRRRLMMAQQNKKPPKGRSELEFFGTGMIAKIAGVRQFIKLNEGWAIVGYCYRVNNVGTKWLSPIIVSTEPEVAKLKYLINGTILSHNVSFEYDGITYYAGQWDYSVSIDSPVEPKTLHFIANGTIFDNTGEHAITKAAKALLDYYFYKTEA